MNKNYFFLLFYGCFATATFSKTAPSGATWVEIGFLKQTAGCVLVDDVCLSESGGTIPCAISATVSTPTCFDNGTPNNPADDSFSFNVLVTNNSGDCGFGWVDNISATPGQYGVARSYHNFPISGGNKTIQFSSGTFPNPYTISITAIAPPTCSGGSLSCGFVKTYFPFETSNANNVPYTPSNNRART
jgi:hypothetical protein